MTWQHQNTAKLCLFAVLLKSEVWDFVTVDWAVFNLCLVVNTVGAVIDLLSFGEIINSTDSECAAVLMNWLTDMIYMHAELLF